MAIRQELPWAIYPSQEYRTCVEQGWLVFGWQPLGDDSPVIWNPCSRDKTTSQSGVIGGSDEGWARILEHAMCGDQLALKAMRDIVTSNPEYYEFQATLEAISATAN